MKVLVTGGLGFIGSAVVRLLIKETDHEVFNLDKITYASTLGSVQDVSRSERYHLLRCDLADAKQTADVVLETKPDAILHLAAESHVDRSIDGPEVFVESNILGTFNLLQAARQLDLQKFVHVSTDEVFGSLSLQGDERFNEHSRYQPNSPYSASKAASDHLARAWGETYEVPVVVTNCSNNYGPFQFPEKLVPLMIIKAISGHKLPVYGDGLNVRDWLFVEDHARALIKVLQEAQVGEDYLIGGNNELSNLDLVKLVCQMVDEQAHSGGYSDLIVAGDDREELIEYVLDRPGHDLRYAIDPSKIALELDWKPTLSFEQGLEKTLYWYLNNQQWWQPLVDEATKRVGVAAMLSA